MLPARHAMERWGGQRASGLLERWRSMIRRRCLTSIPFGERPNFARVDMTGHRRPDKLGD